MAAVEAPGASSRTSDTNELAGFGYKQELDRSLGSFSAFAAGFSYISILTGVTALYGFGYLNAGPGVWWTWPVVVVRSDPGRAVLHGDGRPVPDRRLGVPVVQADLERLHVVDDRLDLHRRRDRHDRGRCRRLADRPAAGHDQAPVLRNVGRRGHIPDQARGSERAAARRDPGRDHDHDQHARRQADVADQQRRRDVRADRLDDPRDPAAVQRAPRAADHLPLLRLRRRPSLGLLRGAARRRPAERVRDVRVRYRGDACRGDQQPAQARPAGDHPRDRGGRDHRRPGDPVRVDGEQARPRQERRTSRPSVRDEAGVRKHRREPVPDRLRDRDLRLLPGRSDGDDPDAVLDGARQPPAGRLGDRARLGSSQGADRAGAGYGRPDAAAAA